MRLGFDVDGVLAAFVPAYERLIVEVTGTNRFPWAPGEGPPEGPPVWDWPQHFGYTEAEIATVWERITHGSTFWAALDPLPGLDTLHRWYPALSTQHDLYFITNRVGLACKPQTQRWLDSALTCPATCPLPTVLITSRKGSCCHALRLDAYIDDNLDNILDVTGRSPETRAYLLDRAYNQRRGLSPAILRVTSVEEMLTREQIL